MMLTNIRAFHLLFPILFVFVCPQAQTAQNKANKPVTRQKRRALFTQKQIDAFYAAIRTGDIPEVKRWIKRGMDLNQDNFFHDTPLYCAAHFHRPEVAKVLIEGGADVNYKSKTGHPPLYYARLAHDADILLLLLKKGAKVNFRDRSGATVLNYAAIGEDDKIVQILLDHKANINNQDNYGSTPLLIAISRKREKVVKLLLERKADYTLKDKEGMTAWKLAQQVKNDERAEMPELPSFVQITKGDEILELLEQAGAKE